MNFLSVLILNCNGDCETKNAFTLYWRKRGQKLSLKFKKIEIFKMLSSSIGEKGPKNQPCFKKLAPFSRYRFSIPHPESHHGVATLISSRSHICLGNGYSIVKER